jgi:hypothetical protein
MYAYMPTHTHTYIIHAYIQWRRKMHYASKYFGRQSNGRNANKPFEVAETGRSIG